ncbi:hypothetical protein M0812_27796 [Anaeramoeba flamelloides]|uniref:Uncharacterized protein n=1 Tax=Anaeramoeba flamelloides TaxID=1746091 RepID=A0AAV7YCU4_9EUKA|nr:hypothetical protein M0812_27796 [Anaeramoeba flamelloides]
MFSITSTFQQNQTPKDHSFTQVSVFEEDSRFESIEFESESEECFNFQIDSRMINNEEQNEQGQMIIEESEMNETSCKEIARNFFVKEKLQEELHEEQIQLNYILEQKQKNNFLKEKRFNSNTSDQTNKLSLLN